MGISKEQIGSLIDKAFEMLPYAYTPYSHYKVGAALLAKNGTVYGGCNIENAAYTPCNCGERTAFFKAVSEGVTEFDAIAVVAGHEGNVTNMGSPCGVCRQVMMEFCDPETFVICLRDESGIRTCKLGELLPLQFGGNEEIGKH